MQDLLDIVSSFFSALFRFKWLVVLIACVISLLGWGYVYQLNDQYQAKARVFVDSNRVLQPLLKGIAIQPDVNQRVQLMSRMLLSRPNLERLSRMSDLDASAVTDYDRELMLDRLGREVRLTGVRGNASLYNVSYTHFDPELAKRMVQSLIAVFIETTIGDERRDSESAQVFLDQQIRLYEKRLAQAEKRLSDFKRENTGKMPGEAGGYYQRLETARSQENAARLQLRETINRRDDLRRQLSREPATLSEGGVAGVSPLDLEISQQKSELSKLLMRYTDRHPQITQLRQSITVLESRKLLGAGDDSFDSGLRVSNPVYEEIRRLLSESTARVAELEVRVEDYERQSRELNETIDSIPRVEAELAQLDRDYTIIKGQFETVLERRESARLSEQVEQNADDVEFRVIDPPFVPSRPTGPDKLLLSAAVFVVGLGAGSGLALALSLLFPVFYDASTIARLTGRSVLGSVSKQQTSSDTLRGLISWIGVAGVVGLLLLIFALLLAFYQGMFANGQLDFLIKGQVGYYFNRALDALFFVVGQIKSVVPGLAN